MSDLTGLVSWYKADSLSASDGDLVDSWADSSGNGWTLSASGGSRPTYRASETNSLPAVEFNGSSNILSSGQNAVPVNLQVAAVVDFASLKTYQGLVAIDGNATPAYHNDFFQWFGYATGNSLVGGNGRFRQYSDAYSAGPSVIRTGLCSGLRTLSIRNGDMTTAPVNTSYLAPPAAGSAYIHLGYVGLGGSYLSGSISELVIYSDAEPSSGVWVEGYLAHKYGVALEPGHLFKEAPPNSAPETYNSGGESQNPFRSRAFGA